MPPRTRAWPLPHRACSSIQLVATSTAQRVKRKKPRGGAATMGDQIDLEEAGASVVPLGEGANGDLLLEPGAGPRGGGPA